MNLKEILQRPSKNVFNRAGIIGVIATVAILLIGWFMVYRYYIQLPDQIPLEGPPPALELDFNFIDMPEPIRNSEQEVVWSIRARESAEVKLAQIIFFERVEESLPAEEIPTEKIKRISGDFEWSGFLKMGGEKKLRARLKIIGEGTLIIRAQADAIINGEEQVFKTGVIMCITGGINKWGICEPEGLSTPKPVEPTREGSRIIYGDPLTHIFSPKRDDKWVKGSIQKIQWSSSLPAESIDILLYQWREVELCQGSPCPTAPPFPYFIAKKTPNDGEFEWQIPREDFVRQDGGKFDLSGGEYFIKIDSGSAIGDASDIFTIVAL